jgi:hypothetical protein
MSRVAIGGYSVFGQMGGYTMTWLVGFSIKPVVMQLFADMGTLSIIIFSIDHLVEIGTHIMEMNIVFYRDGDNPLTKVGDRKEEDVLPDVFLSASLNSLLYAE